VTSELGGADVARLVDEARAAGVEIRVETSLSGR
jgi:hypothetical protein